MARSRRRGLSFALVPLIGLALFERPARPACDAHLAARALIEASVAYPGPDEAFTFA